ncbi:MAG: ABC transporter substrate-binding protein [Proteobacteria bacterium]|nr:ABC transporter substrate-binding protein [Pseudomonadota bacterium]
MRRLQALAALLGAILFLAGAAGAAELTIGLAVEPTSVDPHFHNLTPNEAASKHIFEKLIDQNEKQQLRPGLAVSWKPIDDLTWEFKLRQGVRWHDGTPFTAADVRFTVERAPKVPNSPSGYGIYLNQIKEVQVVDDHTVRLKTAAPYPLMATDISTIAIVSKKHGEGATTADYNSGKAAVGTGPYKFERFTPGDRYVFVRNSDYWGPKAEWDRVTLRFIKNDSARVAALLAGDVDVIEQVPTADIENLKKNPKVALSQGVSNRVIFLHMDHARDDSPFAKAKDGGPIKNPLRDLRVRKAISKAINRQAIIERVMEGVALPAAQLLPEGFFGVSPKLEPEKYDPEGAKKLLAEAGLANGFRVTLHGPNDRYINDAKIAQAVAQMLTRVGIQTEVQTMPASVFFARGSKLEFSFLLVGWGAGSGEASSPLKSLLATFDKDKGRGASNRGRYSNPEMDRLLEQALVTVDDGKREALLQRATELAINDLGIIPLHFQVNTWAARRGLRYVPRTDEHTLATSVTREGA